MLRTAWGSGTGGSRGERKHSTTPGDAQTFVNPTCNASARLVKLYSNYVSDFVFVLFCFASLLLFLGVMFARGSGKDVCCRRYCSIYFLRRSS